VTLIETPRSEVVAPFPQTRIAPASPVQDLEYRVATLEGQVAELAAAVKALLPPPDILADKFQAHVARFRAKEQE